MKPTMIACPACKKIISDSAETCPKCGHPMTEQEREVARATAKKGRKGCAVAIAVVLALAVIGSMCDKDKKNTGQTAAPEAVQEQAAQPAAPTFPLTAEDIVEQFNQSARKMGFAHQAVMTKTSNGPEVSTVQVLVGEHIAWVITTPKGARNASSIMYIGVGDGSFKSGATILEGINVMIAALSPELDGKGRGKVLRELGLMSGKGLPKDATAERGKVKYNYGFVEGMGSVFSVEAI